MADADFDDVDDYGIYPEPAQVPRSFVAQRWFNAAGALTSIALIVGLGVWTYDLAMRDVHGIPVIQALEGPARVTPENPGGELALHQGLSVNEIAADGTAKAPSDTLTLAPRPEGLAEEDQPMGDFAAVLPELPKPAVARPAPEPLSPGAPAPRIVEPLPDGPVEPIVDAPGAVTETEQGFVASDLIPATVPGVSASPRPQTRPPIDAMAEAAAAAVAAAMADPVLDVEPSALETGVRLVQIGAYPDESAARLEWDKVATRFSALMDGKRRVIEPASSNGETFYRLRVEGFADIDEARSFCAALKAENAECVPATVQ